MVKPQRWLNWIAVNEDQKRNLAWNEELQHASMEYVNQEKNSFLFWHFSDISTKFVFYIYMLLFTSTSIKIVALKVCLQLTDRVPVAYSVHAVLCYFRKIQFAGQRTSINLEGIRRYCIIALRHVYFTSYLLQPLHVPLSRTMLPSTSINKNIFLFHSYIYVYFKLISIYF